MWIMMMMMMRRMVMYRISQEVGARNRLFEDVDIDLDLIENCISQSQRNRNDDNVNLDLIENVTDTNH